MRKLLFSVAGLCLALMANAQDTTSTTTITTSAVTGDTVRVGNVTIIKYKGLQRRDSTSVQARMHRPKNMETTWFMLDLGFTNYTDNTDYSSATAQAFAPGATKDWFKLKPSKSVNVNIWFFQQRVNMIKHIVNLRYGVGLELNNYRYKENIRFEKSPTLIYQDDIDYRKNKLAADYITVPVMLDFNFTPKAYNEKSFGISVGASAGYLYTARQKFISDETGKDKVKDDFDLRQFKISYVAEIKLSRVRLYGSLASKSIFEKGLDQTPYTMGIRLAME